MRRFIMVSFLASLAAFVAIAADKETDTPKAAATRKKLQKKISVNYKDTLFRDVRDDLKEKVDGLGVLEDLKGGVNLNLKITYKADDATLESVLNALCDKFDMGYYVISKQNTGYDGSIKFTRNKDQRGFETGKGPDKAASKDKDKPKDKEAQNDRSPGRDKAVNKDKSEEKPKNEKPAKDTEPEDEVQKAERQAALKLAAIKGVIGDGKTDRAIELCEELLKKYPATKAAKEANELLEKLKN